MSSCQSNMKQIALSVTMYSGDYEDTYPCNKTTATAVTNSKQVFLPAEPTPANYAMIPYVLGLDKYIQKASGADSVGVWKCPSVGNAYWPNSTGTIPSFGKSRITYAINFNLLEETEGTAKFPASTLLFREMGINDQSYACASSTATVLPDTVRPLNIFYGSEAGVTGVPSGAYAALNTKVHGDSSNVAFLDGHVASFAKTTLNDAAVVNTLATAVGKWVLPEPGSTTSGKIWISP